MKNNIIVLSVTLPKICLYKHKISVATPQTIRTHIFGMNILNVKSAHVFKNIFQKSLALLLPYPHMANRWRSCNEIFYGMG
jgi:hypothetical protein